MSTFSRLLVGVLLCSAVNMAISQQDSFGEARCVFTPSDECHLGWTMRNSDRPEFSVQLLDSGGRWVDVEQSNAEEGQSAAAVAPGALYRVLACYKDDGGVEQSCLSSTMYWSPILPKSVDQIPSMLPSKDSVHMITKSASLRYQTSQYNVYKLVEALEDVKVSVLPAMTRPSVEVEDIKTQVDAVEVNVYGVFDDMVKAELGISLPYEEPGELIHPDGHPPTDHSVNGH